MNVTVRQQKANSFLKLHDRSRILVLPNAWDVVSARLVAEAGFPAIATTSAGIAWMLGYPDGQFIRREEMLDIVRRIAQRVSVPSRPTWKRAMAIGRRTPRRPPVAFWKRGRSG
jgi:2-methylisocitrate lyase-like PEP mutase family enzyme